MRNGIWYALVFLGIEKTIQHLFVTYAFWKDIGDIRSQVAVSPNILMISGFVVALLFLISIWGLLTFRKWAIDLLIGLALFDIIGEFIAQGRLDIKIPLSFVVAILILLFAIIYRRQVSASVR